MFTFHPFAVVWTSWSTLFFFHSLFDTQTLSLSLSLRSQSRFDNIHKGEVLNLKYLIFGWNFVYWKKMQKILCGFDLNERCQSNFGAIEFFFEIFTDSNISDDTHCRWYLGLIISVRGIDEKKEEEAERWKAKQSIMCLVASIAENIYWNVLVAKMNRVVIVVFHHQAHTLYSPETRTFWHASYFHSFFFFLLSVYCHSVRCSAMYFIAVRVRIQTNATKSNCIWLFAWSLLLFLLLLKLLFSLRVLFLFVNLLSFQKHVINAQIFVLRILNKILFRIFTSQSENHIDSESTWNARDKAKDREREWERGGEIPKTVHSGQMMFVCVCVSVPSAQWSKWKRDKMNKLKLIDLVNKRVEFYVCNMISSRICRQC